MGIKQEQINPIESHAIDFGPGGQIEHRVEIDARLGPGTSFADQAGPHGIVKFRKIVGLRLSHGDIIEEKTQNANCKIELGIPSLFACDILAT
jgi:hypothetical protein